MKVYHLTRGNRVESIMKYGLIGNYTDNFDYGASRQRGVYVSSDTNTPYSMFEGHVYELFFIGKKTYESGWTLLSFDVDPKDLRQDENSSHNSYLVDYVDPSMIEIVDHPLLIKDYYDDYETAFIYMMNRYVQSDYEEEYGVIPTREDADQLYEFIHKRYTSNISDDAKKCLDTWLENNQSLLTTADLDDLSVVEINLPGSDLTIRGKLV